MQDLIRYVILGIPVGCVFALMAIGLVLTYKTSGVFNLAFAAQAFLSAAVYYDVHVRHGWPIVPAFVLAVLIVSPLVGLLIDRFVFRFLRGASPIGKLVSSLGLLVALPQIVLIWLGPSQTFGIVGIWWDDDALVPLRRLRGRRQADGDPHQHRRGGARPGCAVPLERDRTPHARGGGEPAAHGARRRRCGSFELVGVDALERDRRSRGRAARAVLADLELG